MKCNLLKYLAWAFGTVSVVLLFSLVHVVRELQIIKADIRLTRDIVWRIDAERDDALEGDVSRAVQYLRMFVEPPDGSTGFDARLASIISLARKAAARDVVAHLRAQTGEDFGNDPANWVLHLTTD